MLTHLRIRNFRRNSRLDVRLQRVTIFRGSSASGKSSLIGALKWITLNQPAGTGFIHWGRNRAAVRLRADRHTISRIRTPELNTYILDKEDLVAFKRGVPSSIANLLNMGTLNFQRQHAGPFWFRETAGEVSRQLNAVVNLDLIDKTIGHLNRQQREVKIKLQDVEERIGTAQEEKDRYAYVQGLESRLRALNDALRAQNRDEKCAERLNDLIERAYEYKRLCARPVPHIEPLWELCEEYQNTEKQIIRLLNLLKSIQLQKERITQTKLILAATKQKLQKLMGKQCPLCGNPTRLRT